MRLKTLFQILRTHRVSTALRRQYQIPVLIAVFIFMTAVRLQPIRKFVTDDGISFAGNDAWYHYRQTAYVVEHWPFTMQFDPLTGYPAGATPGQFGTIFDQLIATVALIVGLGSPTDTTIRLVAILAPPILAGLVLIPTYYLATRLHSRRVGVISAISLGLLPGMFLSRSVVAFYDHHIAEVLFMTIAVVVLLDAMRTATHEVVIIELLLNREFNTIATALLPAGIAGLAISLYILVWPPGVLFVAISAIFYTLYACICTLQKRLAEPVLLVGAVSNLVVTGVLIAFIDTWEVSVAAISPVQVGLTAATAVGCLFLIGLIRVFEQRSISPRRIPLTIGGILIGTIVGFSVLFPETAQFLNQQSLRAIGFGQHANQLTIAEAQPFLGFGGVQRVLQEYGMLFGTGMIGFAILGYRIGRDAIAGREIASPLFMVVWTSVLVLAAFTQMRFNYYLAVPVVILAAYAVVWVFDSVQISTAFPRLEPYQWLLLIMVIGIVFVPILVLPFETTAVAKAQHHSAGEYAAWDETLTWMSQSTPAYESVETYGAYDESSFAYGPDVYGVMSWWDYGHYTTVDAERAAIANPFQQNAALAAKYLLATDEDEAQAIIQEQDENASARYVMVDWKMVTPTSKFGAPVVWHPDLEQADMMDITYREGANGYPTPALMTMEQRYYESLMVRLYNYHGSAITTSNLVVEYDHLATTDQAGDRMMIKTVPTTQHGVERTSIRRFESPAEARAFVEQSDRAQIGGIGLHPREEISALEHYRLVKTSEQSAFESASYIDYLSMHGDAGDLAVQDFTRNAAWVKVFERVPGATIEGTGAPANGTVGARVVLYDHTRNEHFIYQQFVTADGNGEFELTVPYSSTGYEAYGSETGQTDLAVTAVSEYEFAAVDGQDSERLTGADAETEQRVWVGTADVHEGQVVGDLAASTQVTLTELEAESAEGSPLDRAGEVDSGEESPEIAD